MLTVADIMSRTLITLSPSDTIHNAKKVMEKARIRHLPIVTKAGKFLGIVTQRDIIKASVSKLADLHNDEIVAIESAIPLAEILNTETTAVPPNFSVIAAGKLLLEKKFGCLPVVENNELKGIITESDFTELAITLLKK